MKITLTFTALLFTLSLSAQTFCLRFSEVSNDGSTFTVGIEMMGSTTFALGSSNLQWSFNTSRLGSPTLASSSLPGAPFYLVEVTTPNPGETSLNIELSFPDIGSDISTSWTEIAQVSYSVLNPSSTGELLWLYNGGTTQTVVFIDNESTQIFATDPSCLENLLAPVPVELLHFGAQVKGERVALDWATATEQNSEGFEVQRSVDGKSWEKLGWVASAGDSFRQQDYGLLDQQPPKGEVYYRLKMVDRDGSFSHSAVAQVTLKSAAKTLRFYPNPVRDVLHLAAREDLLVERVVVYDQLGRVRLQREDWPAAGLVLTELAEGWYSVEEQVAGQVYQQPFMRH